MDRLNSKGMDRLKTSLTVHTVGKYMALLGTTCLSIYFTRICQKIRIWFLGTWSMPSSKTSNRIKLKNSPAAEKKCQISWWSYRSPQIHSTFRFLDCAGVTFVDLSVSLKKYNAGIQQAKGSFINNIGSRYFEYFNPLHHFLYLRFEGKLPMSLHLELKALAMLFGQRNKAWL